MSLPFELRRLAAFDAKVLSAVSRIFSRAVAWHYESRAKTNGLASSKAGSITCVQRFGGALNLNVHFHLIALDGVFTRAGGRVVFHAAPTPAMSDLRRVLERVHHRVVRWLRQNGHTKATPLEDESNEPPGETPLDRCAAVAMGRGRMTVLGDAMNELSDVGEPPAPPAQTEAATHLGFNVHASVTISADDDLGRERLCRYGMRPPFSLDRFRRLPDGLVGYRVKKWRDGRAKLLVMTPIELMARLAALTPPPRFPLLRYHGVLGPRSSWRKEVVPRPRSVPANPHEPATTPAIRSFGEQPGGGSRSGLGLASNDTARSAPEEPTRPSVASDALVFIAPNVISVPHWRRLREGLLLTTSPRLSWARLLARTFDVDVLECASCGGRLRVLGVVEERAEAARRLLHLAMVTEQARARDPTQHAVASTSA